MGRETLIDEGLEGRKILPEPSAPSPSYTAAGRRQPKSGLRSVVLFGAEDREGERLTLEMGRNSSRSGFPQTQYTGKVKRSKTIVLYTPLFGNARARSGWLKSRPKAIQLLSCARARVWLFVHPWVKLPRVRYVCGRQARAESERTTCRTALPNGV